MSEIPFHQTRMGRDFFDRTMPELVKQLARLNDILERLARQADAEAQEE
jgi:hypothetical protein